MTVFGPEYAGLAKKAECWETDEWAIKAILACEILTPIVVDPCCGPGRMSIAAAAAGYQVHSYDLYDWGFGNPENDFLKCEVREGEQVYDNTVFMNSPFSLACEFVDQARLLGARKIVAFQRFEWWESKKRRAWRIANPPNRIYVCGDRANCDLVTYPQELRDAGDGTKRTHAWYVWERGNPSGTLIGEISKSMAGK